MNMFYAVNGKKIKRIIFLITTLMFATAIVYVERNNISVFSYEDPTAIYGAYLRCQLGRSKRGVHP